MRGIEPPRGCPHRHLKPARLPIPPHPRRYDILAYRLEWSSAFCVFMAKKHIPAA